MTWLWWIIPLVMIFFCIFMMRGCMGASRFGRTRHSRGGSALDILDKRYARGEIDKREYQEKKRDIEAQV